MMEFGYDFKQNITEATPIKQRQFEPDKEMFSPENQFEVE
jgi:hypothetical protein